MSETSTASRRAARHPDSVRELTYRMAEAAGAESRYLARGTGEKVHVLESGHGSAIVHLHGTMTSALSHLMLIEHMPHHRSYLVDRPGRGLSDGLPGRRRYHRDDAISFVGEVLDLLDVQSPVLVGASGGGVWATWFALAHPERVRSLVLLGAVPTFPGAHAPLPLRLMATPVVGSILRVPKPNRRMMLGIMKQMGEGESFGDHSDLLDSLVLGARDPVAVAANVVELRALTSVRGIRRDMRLTADDLRSIAVPTLMIWGDQDPVVPVQAAREAAALIPEARLEILPAGHVPQLRHPHTVATLIKSLSN
jgi:pimeloyl-ACP methyl ester carboxylesterase